MTFLYSFSIGFPCNVQQDADAGQGKEQRGATRGDQWKGNSLGGHKRKHDADVEERLQENCGGDAEGYQPGEWVLRTKCGAQPAGAEDRSEEHTSELQSLR